MRATTLLGWIEQQSYEMCELSTVHISDYELSTHERRYDFFNHIWGGQPIGKVEVGLYAYMYFDVDDYQNFRSIFATEEPSFVIIKDGQAILFHLIDEL